MAQTLNRKTSGTVFPNGMIELVADPTDEGRLVLLSWAEGKGRIQPRARVERPTKWGPKTELQTITFEPEDLDPTFRRAMRFPSRVDSFGSSRELLDSIFGIIKRFTGLADDHVLLAAHSALASWFLDATDFPAALVICGPLCPQGERLFRVLSCLYRRALLLGEISLASLCSLPMNFSPSLFIERYDHSPEFQRVIRATRTRGSIPSKGKFVSTRCTTVICSEEPLNGAIPDGHAIEIPVSHTRVPLPVLNEAAQQSIAEEFQPKLLMYRLMNHAHVRSSTFEAASLTSSVNELARSLGSCVVDNPDRQEDIIRLLKEKDARAQEEDSWDLRVTVLEALLLLCHKKKESIHVGEVADVCNSNLDQIGELLVLTPRTVGNKLRVLGLTTRRLDSAGRGLFLTAKIRERIHRLAWDYKLQLQPGREEQCDDCLVLEMEQKMEAESRADEVDEISHE